MSNTCTATRRDTRQCPGVFGERGDYWSKHDKLASAYNKDMLEGLNGDLDVLLIFAGLFSAINTAFIVVTLAGLSPGPADTTNALLIHIAAQLPKSTITLDDLSPPFKPTTGVVRQNCTFFASLCSSLLAAAGAVVAKQWLQYHARSTGALDHQGLERTARFMGAESWSLQAVVQFLSPLLLVSLGLFFVGLVDYLWSLNRSVAIVVLVFTGVGAGFSTFTSFSAALFPRCPFRTAFSARFHGPYPFKNIRYLSKAINYKPIITRIVHAICLKLPTAPTVLLRLRVQIRYIISVAREIIQFLRLSTLPLSLWLLRTNPFFYFIAAQVIPWFSRWLDWNAETSNTDQLRVGSALWMVETTSEIGVLITVAQNIPYITNLQAMRLVLYRPVYLIFVTQAQLSLTNLQTNRSEESLNTVVTVARAVANIVLADSDDATWDAATSFPTTAYEQAPLHAWRELVTLWLVIVAHWCRHEDPLRTLVYAIMTSVAGETLSPVEIRAEGYRQGVTYLHNVIVSLPSIISGSPVPSTDRPRRNLPWINIDRGITFHDMLSTISKVLSMEAALDDTVVIFASLALSGAVHRSTRTIQRAEGNLMQRGLEADGHARAGVTEAILNLLACYHAYFTFLEDLPNTSPDEQLLWCQSQLLLRLRALHPSWSVLLHVPERSAADTLLCFHRVRFAVSSNLLEVLGLIVSSRAQQVQGKSQLSVELLQTSRNELLQTLRCLLRTSFPAPVDIDGPEISTWLALTQEMADEENLGAVVDIGAYAMESMRVFQGRSAQTFLKSYPAFLPLVLRGLSHHDAHTFMDASKALVALIHTSYYPEGAMPPFELNKEMSNILTEEHVVDAMVGFLARSSRRKHDNDSVNASTLSGLVNWLTEMVRCRAAELRMEDVVKLLIGFSWSDEDGLRAALGMLFLEVWGDDRHVLLPWSSRAAVQAMSAALRCMDQEAIAVTANLTAVNMPSINYATTFRYAEQALHINPWSAVTNGLDVGCGRLARRLRDEHPTNANELEMQWARTRTSYGALRGSMNRNSWDAVRWRHGGLAAAHRTPFLEVW